MLEGVTNALLWLHYGYQDSYKDGDWNPIALINIHPGASMFSLPRRPLSPFVCLILFVHRSPLLIRKKNKIVYFTAPQGDETYGIAKVSSFEDAIVMPKKQAAHDAVRVKTQARENIGNYVAPVSIFFFFFFFSFISTHT